VLDGTWPQTSRMGKRLDFLNDLAWVKIPAHMINNRPRLRSEHTRTEGMATMEAVAHAYSILENTAIGSQLLSLYDLMVERWLSSRSRP
jgi:DTW domain-containing protein YfiP